VLRLSEDLPGYAKQAAPRFGLYSNGFGLGSPLSTFYKACWVIQLGPIPDRGWKFHDRQ